MNWDEHHELRASARAEVAANRKSPAPVSADSWLLSVLNGDGESTARQIDAMTTATVNRAIRKLSNDLAACPVVIETQKAGGSWEMVDVAPRGQKNPQFGDVAGVFARANPNEGRSAMWRKFHQGKFRDGSVYLFNDYLNAGAEKPKNPPRELRALRASRVTPIFPQQRGLFDAPAGYLFKTDTGSRKLRPDELMLHLEPDIEDDWIGMDLLKVISPYASMEDALVAYQREFFDNGARGTVALESDQTPSDAQRQQLEQAWNNKNVGRGRRFKVWLLTHGLKAKELTGRRDTDFADMPKIIKEAVSMTFAIPMSLLSSLEDSGDRANLDEQTPQYFEGALAPEGDLLEQNLTEVVLPRFDPNGSLRARLDWNRTPLVQRMMLKRATTYFTLVGGPIFTPNEARKALNMEPLTAGDQTYPTMGQPSGIGPVQTPRPARSVRLGPSRKWIDDPARHAKRIASGVSLDRFEKPAEKMVRAYFTQAEARALHAFENGKGIAGLTKDAGAIFDEEIEVDAATGLIARIYAFIANIRGPEAAEIAGGERGDFLITDPAIQDFLAREAYDKGTLITGTTKERIREALATANADGLTVQETANMIRDVFGQRRSDALMIARTETVRAYNVSTFEAFKQTGLVEQVSWLTANDDAVRDSHRDLQLDGEKVKLGEPFSNGCRFPGDPEGDASETINCRCVLDTVEEPVRSLTVAPGTFRKLFPKAPLTNGNSFTDKAAL